MKSLINLLTLGILLTCISCASSAQIKLEADGIYALNGKEAAYHLTTDKIDHFFERINSNEISLQMKQNMLSSESDLSLINQYKEFLRSDVRSFSSSDIDYLNETFNDLYQNAELNAISLPDSILLIKVAGNHYGNSVYYTRENCIIIPENVLNDKDSSAFSGVMLHEIFHIFSRYNPGIQEELYEVIGFSAVQDIQIPKALDDRLIYNPDGLDMNWMITLQSEGEPIQVCPIILSRKKPKYKMGLFPNFEFKLYGLQRLDDGSYLVDCNKAGDSLLDQQKMMGAYFNVIGTNTGYIIHPDEILADHFMMLMRGDTVNLNQLPFEGNNLELLQQIKDILSN